MYPLKNWKKNVILIEYICFLMCNYCSVAHFGNSSIMNHRSDSKLVPSQWEMSLQSNAESCVLQSLPVGGSMWRGGESDGRKTHYRYEQASWDLYVPADGHHAACEGTGMECWRMGKIVHKKYIGSLFVTTCPLQDVVVILTHWGRVTHICVSDLTSIGSDNGLSPGWRQTIIRTDAGILLIGPLATKFSENLIRIQTFSFKKMHLKMSSTKLRLFCLGLNVLKG